MKRELYIVGGSRAFKDRLLSLLTDRFLVTVVDSGEEAVSRLQNQRPSVILLSARLPDQNGLEVLEGLLHRNPSAKTILFSGFQDMATTIQAMKLGAFDCVREDIEPAALEKKIRRAFKILSLGEKIKPVQEPASTDWTGKDNIIGQNQAMRDIYKFIGRISGTTANVGIRGETGTGKELVARVIHQNSANRDEPFITVDCSTIVESLSESILYGHERGSFTGAIESRRGRFEIAGDGTIFLDEIADLPLSLQSKLLRFLQEKEYQRIGSTRTKKSKARIIAATNRDLQRAISEGRFRKDLYYRLKVLTVLIPPLRERKEDIPLLIQHFFHKINRQHQTGVLKIEDRAVQVLMEYDWPGNVRELENLLVLASILGREEVILEETVKSILNKSRRLPPDRSPVPTLDEAEAAAINRALKFTGGNLSQAARLLDISRQTLRTKIKKHGLTV